MKVMRAGPLARNVSERGNDNATADVRPHAWTAAALLALGALVLLVRPRLATYALLGGATLVMETAILWYLPSFAKRAVLGPDWIAAIGPALLGAAAVTALFPLPFASILAVLGLLHLTILVLASATLGAPWRSGIPFWRAGPHQRGDRAAAIVMLLGLLVLAASPLVHPLSIWPAGLAILALGALTHLLPRSRGRAPIAPLVLAGAAVASLAAVARFYAPTIPSWLAPAGILLAAAGLYAGPSPKRAGPRLREAAPPILAALAATALAIAGLSAALSVAAGLAVFAVALLALPVVFNQRPARAFILPASVAAAGVPLAALLPAPTGPIAGAVAVALALATLAPLRRPRRYCPPEGPEAS